MFSRKSLQPHACKHGGVGVGNKYTDAILKHIQNPIFRIENKQNKKAYLNLRDVPEKYWTQLKSKYKLLFNLTPQKGGVTNILGNGARS